MCPVILKSSMMPKAEDAGESLFCPAIRALVPKQKLIGCNEDALFLTSSSDRAS